MNFLENRPKLCIAIACALYIAVSFMDMNDAILTGAY